MEPVGRWLFIYKKLKKAQNRAEMCFLAVNISAGQRQTFKRPPYKPLKNNAI